MCKLNKNNGFTMIEVMLSIVIVMIGIFAVMSLVMITVKGNLQSKGVTIATTMAQGKLEEINNTNHNAAGYNAIVSDPLDPGDAVGSETHNTVTYYRTVNVQDDTPSLNTKTVTVDVFWGPLAGTSTTHNNVELQTVVRKE